MKLTISPFYVLVATGAFTLASCETPQTRLQSVDTDRDGQLNVSELEVALTNVVWGISDADGDGKVTYAEILKADPESPKREFLRNDTDSSGTLSRAELGSAIERKGAFKELSKKIDTDGDGVINPDEAAVFHDAMAAADGAQNFKQLEKVLN